MSSIAALKRRVRRPGFGFHGMDSAFVFRAEVQRRVASAGANDLVLGVRPEAVLVERSERTGYVPAEVHLIEPQGAYDILDIRIGKPVIRARTESRFVTQINQRVWVKLDENQMHFFDKKSGLALRAEP